VFSTLEIFDILLLLLINTKSTAESISCHPIFILLTTLLYEVM